MSKNLMPEVAKLLGVQLGEWFSIKADTHETKSKFKLTRSGVINDYGIIAEDYLHYLLNGDFKIIKQPKLTEAERVILENIGRDYKWIYRDFYGNLMVSEEKPVKYDGGFETCSLCDYINAFNHLFKFIKREDEEPYNIKELLKGVNK